MSIDYTQKVKFGCYAKAVRPYVNIQPSEIQTKISPDGNAIAVQH